METFLSLNSATYSVDWFYIIFDESNLYIFPFPIIPKLQTTPPITNHLDYSTTDHMDWWSPITSNDTAPAITTTETETTEKSDDDNEPVTCPPCDTTDCSLCPLITEPCPTMTTNDMILGTTTSVHDPCPTWECPTCPPPPTCPTCKPCEESTPCNMSQVTTSTPINTTESPPCTTPEPVIIYKEASCPPPTPCNTFQIDLDTEPTLEPTYDPTMIPTPNPTARPTEQDVVITDCNFCVEECHDWFFSSSPSESPSMSPTMEPTIGPNITASPTEEPKMTTDFC